MKLNDFIEEKKYDYNEFAIGVSSGFIFIGPYIEYLSVRDKLSQDWLDWASKLLYRYEKSLKLKLQNGPPKREKYSDETEWKLDVDKHEKKLKLLRGSISRVKGLLDDFTPFTKRKVREAYKSSEYQDRLICRIDGDEEGRYWFREEYLKDYGDSLSEEKKW